MISLLLVLGCFIGGQVLCAPQNRFYDLEDAEELFEEFIRTFDKQYIHDEEKQMRFEIFKENLLVFNENNLMHNSSSFGINMFADLKDEEFQEMYLGLNLEGYNPTDFVVPVFNTTSAPENFDWRQKNIVSRVKNQNPCNSCWTFSITGNLEAQYALKHNVLKEFSEQQLMDCVYQGRSRLGGCNNGGWMTDGMEYVQKAGGIVGEQDYPYDKSDAKNCRFDKRKVQAQVVKVNRYRPRSEDELKDILFNVGPISIGVDAKNWNHYRNGILPQCSTSVVNHGVLLVGYGVENNMPYWLIKNSWGPSYGENGYIRVKRGVNACKIMDADGMIVSASVA